MNGTRVKNLVAFLVLMEGHGGVLNKAPEYILEKFADCIASSEPVGLLDEENTAKYHLWFERWGRYILE